MPEGCRTNAIAESMSSVNIIDLPPSTNNSTNNPTKPIGVQSDVERGVNTDAHISMPHLTEPATTRNNNHPTNGHLNRPQSSVWPPHTFATPPPQATASNITKAWAALESARKFITPEEYSVLSAHLASPQTCLASNANHDQTANLHDRASAIQPLKIDLPAAQGSAEAAQPEGHEGRGGKGGVSFEKAAEFDAKSTTDATIDDATIGLTEPSSNFADHSPPSPFSPSHKSTVAELCEELGIDASLASESACPCWYKEISSAQMLDTSALVSNIEPYASRFARALRTERRRQMTMHQQPPNFESKLKDFVVLPLNISSERDPYPPTHILASNYGLRQSFAINYSNMLECLLDLYFISLFQETEARPAANRTLSYLSNVGTKIPGLSASALTMIRLEPTKQTGHDGINLVLNEITLNYLSGNSESGEQRFLSITWEGNTGKPAKHGNTAASLFDALVAVGVPLGKSEAEIIRRWRSLIDQTASKPGTQGEHAGAVASVYTRAGGAGLSWNTFAALKPTLNAQTGQPIAARVPLPRVDAARYDEYDAAQYDEYDAVDYDADGDDVGDDAYAANADEEGTTWDHYVGMLSPEELAEYYPNGIPNT